MSATARDYLKLHLVIFLWGLTAILGKLIELPSIPLVLYRSALTALVLVGLVRIQRQNFWVGWHSAAALLGTGFLIGLHWILFFLSARVGNVSVCLVALSTTAFWTALLEPLLVSGRKARLYEFVMGAVMIGAIAWIVGDGEFRYLQGFLIGLGSAWVGTVFGICNGRFAGKFHHHVITCYEMAGAAIFCAVCLPFSRLIEPEEAVMNWIPSWTDGLWLAVLVGACTVYAFSAYVELLKRVSVFAVSLVYNLEPVYGMILAAVLFAEHEALGGRFYGGAIVILIAVVVHPFLENQPEQK